MATYLISYDLKRTKNYPRLYKLLLAWRAKRVLDSLWVAKLAGPASMIREVFRQFVDHDDAVFVTELPPGVDWAAFAANPAGIAMLRSTSAPFSAL